MYQSPSFTVRVASLIDPMLTNGTLHSRLKYHAGGKRPLMGLQYFSFVFSV